MYQDLIKKFKTENVKEREHKLWMVRGGFYRDLTVVFTITYKAVTNDIKDVWSKMQINAMIPIK